MHKYLNKKQRESLASFFSSTAVGWFSAAFIVIYVSPQVTWLIFSKFLVNMMGSLYISMWLLKEE